MTYVFIHVMICCWITPVCDLYVTQLTNNCEGNVTSNKPTYWQLEMPLSSYVLHLKISINYERLYEVIYQKEETTCIHALLTFIKRLHDQLYAEYTRNNACSVDTWALYSWAILLECNLCNTATKQLTQHGKEVTMLLFAQIMFTKTKFFDENATNSKVVFKWTWSYLRSGLQKNTHLKYYSRQEILAWDYSLYRELIKTT